MRRIARHGYMVTGMLVTLYNRRAWRSRETAPPRVSRGGNCVCVPCGRRRTHNANCHDWQPAEYVTAPNVFLLCAYRTLGTLTFTATLINTIIPSHSAGGGRAMYTDMTVPAINRFAHNNCVCLCLCFSNAAGRYREPAIFSILAR